MRKCGARHIFPDTLLYGQIAPHPDLLLREERGHDVKNRT